jgi:aspartyl-tRNA(Asn)/glutamyl-tRNA(Gln) amidotransferase subunit B
MKNRLKSGNMPEYNPTIGLEIHAELKTKTKMFCDSLNDPEEKHPNVNVCPVCMGHPGTLPVANKQAIEHVIKVGLALEGKPNERSRFDRKNYFYPDLPKAYQISQSGQPLMMGGSLRGVKINHIHLEEDAGKLVHDTSGATLVDYNRAGVPLMELVTEPDLHSAEDAVAFMKELQLILRYLGVSDADLEHGQMRADANISISPNDKLGTRAEVKNLNSFKSVFQAINYEIKRQTEMLEKGESVHQETRGWDDAKQKTTSQRSKEESQDYRYFPEPDLPSFETSVFEPEKLKKLLPELPTEKRVRFMNEYGLNEKQVELLIVEPNLAIFFEEAISELKGEPMESGVIEKGGGLLFNYLTSDLRGLMNISGITFKELKIRPEHLANLVTLIYTDKITSRQAKDMLAKMFETGADPEEIMKSENIGISSDEGEIEAVVFAVIGENHAAVADYHNGKTASLQFLIGKAMSKLKGKARPDMLKDLFERNLRQ